ncbi:MAG: hypothetical protein ACYDER_06760 [Ktedonobacteraceae bacterium]
MAQATPFSSSWQGSLRDLATISKNIRRSHAQGRLTIRNIARLGVAHLYFRGGRLIHVVGNHLDANATFADLRTWSKATVRFERGVLAHNEGNVEEYEHLLDDVLLQLRVRGITTPPENPRVVESHLVSASQSQKGLLLTPAEWRALVEGTRRVSLAVAHLVGPKEALSVLSDILDDCTSGFHALSGMHLAASGYLEITQTTQLERVSRNEILEGFAALFATCQYFCAPIIGDEDAHRLLISALSDIGPALVKLGVFQINRQLLSPHLCG